MKRVNLILMHPSYRERLEEIDAMERERPFCRHGMSHFLDTARLMALRAEEEHLNIPREVLYAAALLHDIGRGAQYADGTPHESAGAAIAGPVLADCGFTEAERESIVTAILSHRSGECGTDLARLLYWADKKSRPCWNCGAARECKWPEYRKNLTLEV